MIQPVLANAGIPMIALALPSMLILVFPVILIEVFSGGTRITKERKSRIWLGVAAANLVSTFIGWPVAWLLLVGLQLITGGGGTHGLYSPLGVLLSVTQQAPWLLPYESELHWMIPVALGVLLVPFFFVSVYVERFILSRVWKLETKNDVRIFSWTSHFYSYGFLLLAVVCYGIASQ